MDIAHHGPLQWTSYTIVRLILINGGARVQVQPDTPPPPRAKRSDGHPAALAGGPPPPRSTPAAPRQLTTWPHQQPRGVIVDQHHAGEQPLGIANHHAVLRVVMTAAG